MPKQNLPTEAEECYLLVEYLTLKGLKHTHIHNEMYTRSWNQKRKAKLLGVSSGVPDYMIVIPEEKSHLEKATLVFIEMKRQGAPPSAVRKVQLKWLEALQEVENVETFVCRGFDEAKKTIDTLTK
jgi:hypothetical protein